MNNTNLQQPINNQNNICIIAKYAKENNIPMSRIIQALHKEDVSFILLDIYANCFENVFIKGMSTTKYLDGYYTWLNEIRKEFGINVDLEETQHLGLRK